MVIKVISGAQTGADIGGLIAAKKFGLETGGWIPKGFITLNGNKPEYAELYGIQELESNKYPPRTYANVRDSDGTLRFAKYFDSPGELCTFKAIKQYNKPYFDCNILNPFPIKNVIKWIDDNNIKILNIAGNTEKTAPGIQKYVEESIAELLTTYYTSIECSP